MSVAITPVDRMKEGMPDWWRRNRNVRDTSVGVDLLEDLVDVRRVRLDPLLGALLATLGLGSRGLGGLLISNHP
jgi:hypothetical protein